MNRFVNNDLTASARITEAEIFRSQGAITTMIFRSVCSGIEAASVAWHPLGWRADAFAEIEKFPSALLAHHYPTTPNLGDMTQYKDWPDATFDVLVGGTPCQSFSVAGLRKGLADPRGNLALVYLGILDRYRPKWMVWENVPGVLSSGDGRDFGAFLGGLGQLGYGFAYRVLDAQYVRVDGFGRAVPQRRRRVFVVGHSSDWRRAAAVLFERDSMSGHPAPRRQAGKGTAPTLSARTKGGGGLGTGFDCDGGLVVRGVAPTLRAGGNVTGGDRPYGTDVDTCDSLIALSGLDGVSHALTAKHSSTGRYDPNGETFIGFSSKDHGGDAIENVAPTLRAMGHNESHANAGGQIAVAHTLKGDGFDASEDGTGRGTPLIAVSYAIQAGALRENAASGPRGVGVQDGHAYTLEARAEVQAVASDMRGREGGAQFEGPHDTANIRAASGGSSRSYVAQPWRVRRLTPMECERLQGFPDGYTQVPYRSKDAADGPRYKALGNSMAINCMRWIGQRIQMVDDFACSSPVESGKSRSAVS